MTLHSADLKQKLGDIVIKNENHQLTTETST